MGNREHRGVPAQPPLPQHRPIAAVGLPEPPPCTPKNPAELQVGRIRFLQPCPRGGSGGCGLVVTAMFLFSSPPPPPPCVLQGLCPPARQPCCHLVQPSSFLKTQNKPRAAAGGTPEVMLPLSETGWGLSNGARGGRGRSCWGQGADVKCGARGLHPEQPLWGAQLVPSGILLQSYTPVVPPRSSWLRTHSTGGSETSNSRGGLGFPAPQRGPRTHGRA